MGKRKLRVGDEVVVIAGNDKGKTGKVLSFRGDTRIVVEGVNIRKKHMKPTQQNQKGQIIDIEMPLDVSNVKPFVSGEAVKLRTRVNKGERELYYLQGTKEVLYRSVKTQKR